MTPEEKAFWKLLIELAHEGLFAGRPDAHQRIMDAFEAAMAAQSKRAT